jgi:hypothetical protein
MFEATFEQKAKTMQKQGTDFAWSMKSLEFKGNYIISNLKTFAQDSVH